LTVADFKKLARLLFGRSLDAISVLDPIWTQKPHVPAIAHTPPHLPAGVISQRAATASVGAARSRENIVT
jgi:hypothetical protein